MIFFKVISLILGVMCVVEGALAFLAPTFWKLLVLEKICPAKKPKWLIPFGVVFVILTLASWVMCLFHLSGYSLMITGFLTLGSIKAAILIPGYDVFRKALVALMTTEKVPYNFIMGSVLLFGLAFLTIGLKISA